MVSLLVGRTIITTIILLLLAAGLLAYIFYFAPPPSELQPRSKSSCIIARDSVHNTITLYNLTNLEIAIQHPDPIQANQRLLEPTFVLSAPPTRNNGDGPDKLISSPQADASTNPPLACEETHPIISPTKSNVAKDIKLPFCGASLSVAAADPVDDGRFYVIANHRGTTQRQLSVLHIGKNCAL